MGETNTIIKKTVRGPDAQAEAEDQMELLLNEIKYEVASHKKKHGVQKEISPEDQFQMASLQPACHTKNFSVDYYLSIDLKYDSGCICCVDLPDAKMKMTIVPLVNPACFGFVACDGWNPVSLGNLICELELE